MRSPEVVHAACPQKAMGARFCSIADCDAPFYAKEMCRTHYRRVAVTGSPHKRDRIADFWNSVRKTDACWLWSGSVNLDGYGWISVHGQSRLAHRMAYELVIGPIEDGLYLDHRCRVLLCVNPDHLRPCTSKQNQENHGGATVKSTSGARNVYWCGERRKWKVQLKHYGKRYNGGSFNSVEEADKAAIELRNRLFTFNVRDRVA